MWIYRPIHSRQCEADLSPRCHPVKTEVQTSFDPDSTAAGVHTYTGTTTNYFSVNGGTTNLDNFNTSPNGGSRDWASSAGNGSFSNPGVVNAVSQADLREMHALGYHCRQQ